MSVLVVSAFTAPMASALENAVVNGGFESYLQAPFRFGQINSSSGECEISQQDRFVHDGLARESREFESPWSGCSTELFSEDGVGNLSTRQPMYGFSPEIKPHSGKAMAGFVPLYELSDGSRKWFERINGTFSAPLQRGVEYTVRFYARDLFEGSEDGVGSLSLQIAFRSGRYRNTKEMISRPDTIFGALTLKPIREADHWLRYEGRYTPTAGGLNSFVIGVLRSNPVAGVDFVPNRPQRSSYDSYYFLDDVEVSCDYRLSFSFDGRSADEIPATPEVDIRLSALKEGQNYELNAGSSWNVGAHSWNVQEVDSAYRPLGNVVKVSSEIPPSNYFRTFQPKKIYKIWLNGGCLGERTDSTPLYVHTGQYAYSPKPFEPLFLRDGLSCQPTVSVKLSGSEWSCGEDARIEVSSGGVTRHRWKLEHAESGQIRTQGSEGAPQGGALSQVFPGLVDAGHYQLTLSVWCDPEGKAIEVRKDFVVNEIPVDFRTSSDDGPLQKEQVLRLSPSQRETGGVTYEWTFKHEKGETRRTGAEAEFLWRERGEYPVEMRVRRENGCVSNRIKTFRVIDPSVYVPDAFTPNADGLNDTFKPVATDVSFDLQIFDRWGALIYQEHFDALQPDLFQGWDGRVQGALPMSGVYTYQVVTHHGIRYNRRGTLTLL